MNDLDFENEKFILMVPIVDVESKLLKTQCGLDYAEPMPSPPGHSCYLIKLKGQKQLDFLEMAGFLIYFNH